MLLKEWSRKAQFDTRRGVKRLIAAVRRLFHLPGQAYIRALGAYEEWLQRDWILPSRLVMVSVFQGRQDAAGTRLPD
jgi:hypothetical protein